MTAVAQDEQTQTGRMKVHEVRGGGGLQLHVREWGRPDGTPILFIHGWSQNHLCWDKQYESALRDEFRLVAYDLRGHGMSEAPPGPGHYTDDKLWADDLAAIIGRLGLERAVLVGWSYGAFAICDYIRAYGQDRVAAFSRVCTHAGCLVGFDSSSHLLVCPCHGAEFDPLHHAAPVAGPASVPLESIPVRIDRSTGQVIAAT